MRRRDFIKVVAGSATAWPFMARAQERIRLVGLLNIVAEDDPEPRLRIAAFKKACRNWVGPTAAYELKHAGLAVTLSVFANIQRNWLRSARTSSSLRAALRLGRYNRQLVRYRSCSCRLLIRWGPDTSKACRARAATLPGSPNSNTA